MKKESAYIGKNSLLLIFGLIVFNLSLFAQPEVDQNRAKYAKVIKYYAQFNTNPDTLVLEDASQFSIGDTVLFHHTISGFAYDSAASIGDIREIKNAGVYGIYLIDTIDGNTVALNNRLPANGVNAFREGDLGQLIKVPTYERARFTSNFVFPEWDPLAKVGGIFPILVTKKLTIEDDVSADGKGFRGAIPSEDYLLNGGKCSDGNFTVDDKYFPDAAIDSGAHKGETFSNNTGNDLEFMTRGRGKIGTAGGGGNAFYAGGGGGGNKGRGGDGGDEADSCASPGTMGGEGGQGILFTTDIAHYFGNRIFMGGGGGTANQDPFLSRDASPGGNGGGIFIIITDTLEVLGSRVISANGSSVETTVDAGAGGGGGGGMIVMDVNTYFGNELLLTANGGDGGSVSGVPFNSGPGGSGGGGAVQLNGFSNPMAQWPTVVAGVAGSGSGTNNAESGESGEVQLNLRTPILGFLFNTIPDDQTICQDQSPPFLNAGGAKGGSGTFNYLWYQSNDTIRANFVPASTAQGPNNQQTYQPPILDDTTYYRRYVEDQVNTNINDTSYRMAINVHPKLEGNYILDHDTVCFNLAPLLALSSDSTLRGGDGNGYSYSWEKSEITDDSWILADGTVNQFDYDVPALTNTSYYRRAVESGACSSISDTMKITVLPSITDNVIGDDQFLCNLQDADLLDGESIGGGETADKRYQWWEIIGGSWSQVAVTEDYTPLALPESDYEYRRIAFSGSEDACIDTSNTVAITVYPVIADNSLNSPADTICADLPTITIDGSLPTGGKTSDYAYLWEKSPDGVGSWVDGSVSPDQEDFQPGVLNTTTWFRRTVYSAISDSACIDVSTPIKVEVLPILLNTLTSTDATICQYTSSPVINGNAASGGLNGDYSYQWEYKENGSDWANASGISDGSDYDPGTLTDTSYFRRVVYSGPLNTCIDITDSLTVFVQPAIQLNNHIAPADVDTCYASEVSLLALEFTGGDGGHTYLWQDSTSSSGAWLNAAGLNDEQNYTKASLIDTTWYRRIAISGACRDTSDSKAINAEALPNLISVSESEPIICTLDELYLLLNMEVKNSDLFLSYSDNMGGNFEDVSVTNDSLSVSSLDFGDYVYTINEVKDANGCISVNSGSPVSVRIDKSLVTTIDQADIFEVCDFGFNLTTTLDSDAPSEFTTIWNILNPNNFVINSSDDQSAIIETAGAISSHFTELSSKITFVQNTVACNGIEDTIEVILYRPIDDLNIVLPESRFMFFRDWDTITVIPDTIGTHIWELNPWALDKSALVTNPNGNPVFIENIPITEYNNSSGEIDNTTELTYTLSNGVCIPRSISLEIIRNEVKVYDGISPRGTPGENDYLIAEGLNAEGISSFSFQIFSTNGMLVRELTQEEVADIVVFSNPDMDDDAMVIWDGKNKNGNKYVSPGTYYYVLVIDFKGLEFVDKGFVVVK